MSEKRCPKCSKSKPLEDYHRQSASTDGLQVYCKMCKAEYDRAWRNANRERAVEMWRAWYKVNSERAKESSRAWQKANPKKRVETAARNRAKYPDRTAARSAVSNAVQSGKLPPPRDLPCSVCGEPAQQYHHHLGYAPEHWLDVVAVCVPCHVELDKEVA